MEFHGISMTFEELVTSFHHIVQFLALLELLRSPDNAARSAAEQRYSACLAAEASNVLKRFRLKEQTPSSRHLTF